MTKIYQVTDEDGSRLDARFGVEDAALILHSRGGVKGQRSQVNADYTRALLLLIGRLAQAAIHISGAWVDSKTVQSLPLSERSILNQAEGNLPSEQICSLLTTRMKGIRSDPKSTAKGGNSTKRIRIATDFSGSSEELARQLGGVVTEGDFRSMERLPAEMLRRATPEYIWRAVQKFIVGDVEGDSFGPSTDYDLIADNGQRLRPKAVFGLALSLALDGEPIGPRHFTAGGLCFTLLEEAGYKIVPKGEAVLSLESEITQDREWREGGMKLQSHLKRERAPGLAKAKKAQYRRTHGRLTCEKCGLDPVEYYRTEEAETCIEVHHSAIQVSQMSDGHKTTLDDLQCLCANCHRLVHRTASERKKKISL